MFRADGFYLNGERLQIFGLNRHQLFPYTGMAAAARLQRRDAEILKNELNCNMVRCSHYPQSPHFLDACDELGLMVWEEPPGWQYVGDAALQDLVVQNVRDMVVRDRSRPSVIVWATRLNETANYPGLYAADPPGCADELDGTRQTTGAMIRHSAGRLGRGRIRLRRLPLTPTATPSCEPPLPGVPYLVSEAVGALDGAPLYRWIDTGAVLADAGARCTPRCTTSPGPDPRYAGLLGWAGIDYASLNGGDRIWQNAQDARACSTPSGCPSPAPRSTARRSTRAVRPVILPVFFWDFGPGSPPRGPGPASDDRHQLRPAGDLRRRHSTWRPAPRTARASAAWPIRRCSPT